MDAHKFGQDDEQRYQEEPLPGQGDQKSLPRVAGGREIGDRHRLYVLEKDEHHVDFEILLGEFEIKFGTCSEYRDDLPREQLQRSVEDDTDHERSADQHADNRSNRILRDKRSQRRRAQFGFCFRVHFEAEYNYFFGKYTPACRKVCRIGQNWQLIRIFAET